MNKEPIDPQFLKLGSANVSEAFEAINSLKEKGIQVIPSLINALQGDNHSIKTMAVIVLGELGESAKDSVPWLVPLLSEENEQTRMASALTLSRIGRDSLSYLLEMLESENLRANFWAAWAISLIDASNINDRTVALLENIRNTSKSPMEIIAAEEALGKVVAKRLKP
jgi:HEAT repeat protein